MQVKLARDWGSHRAGKSVEVPDADARWLIQHNYAESVGDVRAPEQTPAAEGTHGADPLAGGDATRRFPRSVPRERDPNRNYARTAEGAPPAAYRPGFGPEDRKREGEAGRDAQASESSPSASGDAPTAPSGPSEASGDSRKPARRRNKSES